MTVTNPAYHYRSPSRTRRPSVVVVRTDQQRWDRVRFGHQDVSVRTPGPS
ncbi:hypothetical protein [Streptomyces formicae]|uniref:Uncharacterized protein n=1 Tax=Streptomyces formicae TaxID=1616117 RepID=A0ABY3WKL5_9ACTN|nr:hypothetical protein [Streptomyces formicae]UNM12024.1 hypothetical protein J4032_11160 [Streptomyces formicae]